MDKELAKLDSKPVVDRGSREETLRIQALYCRYRVVALMLAAIQASSQHGSR